ncbi:hypothetical protein BDZ89DRAFT_1054637 [Hymenopellis radicata]|nr:hypothetical protein BDZ89DRAFT_1054637 [Hymenopellis radicata]
MNNIVYQYEFWTSMVYVRQSYEVQEALRLDKTWGDKAALGEARRKEVDEEKKAKAREASRKSMAKKRANFTPQEKAADRQVQNEHSAKHRLWHRLDILKAEDTRRHSDPDKPKRRRVARLKRPHDYPHEDRHEYDKFNEEKKAKKARVNAKLAKGGKNGSGKAEEEEDDLDESDESGELDELDSDSDEEEEEEEPPHKLRRLHKRG